MRGRPAMSSSALAFGAPAFHQQVLEPGAELQAKSTWLLGGVPLQRQAQHTQSRLQLTADFTGSCAHGSSGSSRQRAATRRRSRAMSPSSTGVGLPASTRSSARERLSRTRALRRTARHLQTPQRVDRARQPQVRLPVGSSCKCGTSRLTSRTSALRVGHSLACPLSRSPEQHRRGYRLRGCCQHHWKENRTAVSLEMLAIGVAGSGDR